MILALRLLALGALPVALALCNLALYRTPAPATDRARRSRC